MATTIQLRDYQRDALTAIADAEARGQRRILAALPTGCGKTILFVEHILRRLPRRALVLVHRDELLQQAAEKFRQIAPGAHLGIVKAEQDGHTARVVLASVQTLSRANRLQRLATDFRTIVIDEAHHAAADSYRAILKHVGAFQPHGPLVLGVTATPYRADGIGLVVPTCLRGSSTSAGCWK